MKSVIIYVSGAPGSGKTTLAKLLSEQLYIPHVASDLIQGGIELTEPGHDRRAAVTSVFIPLMIDMAQKKISFIVDQALQKDIAKSIIDELTPYATVLYVHVQTKDPIGRYIYRIETSDLPDIIRRREPLLKRAQFHKENLSNTQNPIDLGVPRLIVNTDDGFNPGLDEIIAFIDEYKSKTSLD
jgi:adenylate kinase family enzyme